MNKDLVPSSDEMKIIESMAKFVIDSKHLDKIGGLPGAIAIALYAREVGLPIMGSLYGGIRSVLGKIEIAPQMMNALIRKAGHLLQTKAHTNEICTIWGKRIDTGEEMTSTFSIQDAKTAKIYKVGGAWETYPRNMLYKSSLSNLAKWLFPDVTGMSYTEGELKDMYETIDISEVHRKHHLIPTNESIETSSKPAEPREPGMSMGQDIELINLTEPDLDHRNRIFANYTKKLGYEVKSFMDIPARVYADLKETIVKYHQHLVEKEMAMTGGENV